MIIQESDSGKILLPCNNRMKLIIINVQNDAGKSLQNICR